jgi:hypothetical protein
VGNGQELIQNAQAMVRLDEIVIAAGVFGLQDNYLALTLGSLAGGTAATEVGGGALASGAAAAVGIHVARDAAAESKGLSTRLLVAITEASIVLLALPAAGNQPDRVLLRLDRAATTSVTKKFGASRRTTLTNGASGQEIGLTSSAAFFSPYAAGAKAVLAVLAH